MKSSLLRELFATTEGRGVIGMTFTLSLQDINAIASICVAATTIGYLLYKWSRDAKGNSCDRKDCKNRHNE
jgi:hypothetical protein